MSDVQSDRPCLAAARWSRGHHRALAAAASCLLCLLPGLGARAAFAQHAATACGVQRWPVKVMIDDDTGMVSRSPVTGTIGELAKLERPKERPPQRGRVPPHELTIYRVRAIVRQMSTESDGDWHLVLADPNDQRVTLIGEIPDSVCALGSPFAGAYSAARRSLRRFGRGATVEITGVGFFDHPHGNGGRLPTISSCIRSLASIPWPSPSIPRHRAQLRPGRTRVAIA